MATKKPSSAPDGLVKARVLVDCIYGKVNDVVQITQAEADASSDVDAHPDAVAYAESLTS